MYHMVRGFYGLQLDSLGNCFCVNYLRKIAVKNSTKIIKQIKEEVFCFNLSMYSQLKTIFYENIL